MIDKPPVNSSVDYQDPVTKIWRVSQVWMRFFQAVFRICFAVSQSGTTAQRPTTELWVGRTYFDTTLGKPVWYEGPGWVDATGSAV
jgi:hypothetical protein